MGEITLNKTVTLHYPNIAVDDIANVGTWTMVYNQGFEVGDNGEMETFHLKSITI